MSEQTANLCTTDACESLRARLAKYEDAEGNPIAWKASGADWCSSIHRNPDAKAWADFFVSVFPGQADKHELMIGWFANAMMAMHDHLKAQPSAVDERAAFERSCKKLGLPLTVYLSPRSGYSNDRTLAAWRAWQARAALTASAPAVEPAYQTCNGKACGWCKEGAEPCLFTEEQRKARATVSEPNHSEQVREIARLTRKAANCDLALAAQTQNLAALKAQPGGVDERAAFEAWARREGIALWRNPKNKEKYYCGAAQQAWESWQNRAAFSGDSHNFKNFHRLLCERFGYTHDENDWRRDQVSLIEHIASISLSVPSHGEQVRELPPFAQKVISKLKRFEECASDSDAGGVDIGRHWLDLLTQLGLLNRVQRSPGLWEISQQGEDVLAAAPSAGSGD